MAHAFAGFVQQTLLDHFVVLEQRAVEEDQIGAANAIGERRIDFGATRDVEERLAGFCVGDFEPDRVAVAAAEIAAPASPFSRNSATLPGTAKASTVRPMSTPAPSRRVGLSDRSRCAAPLSGAQDIEDRNWLSASRSTRSDRVDRERLAFAKLDEAGDMVDVGIGDDDGLDRRIA